MQVPAESGRKFVLCLAQRVDLPEAAEKFAQSLPLTIKTWRYILFVQCEIRMCNDQDTAGYCWIFDRTGKNGLRRIVVRWSRYRQEVILRVAREWRRTW